jgi:hypothetical protein
VDITLGIFNRCTVKYHYKTMNAKIDYRTRIEKARKYFRAWNRLLAAQSILRRIHEENCNTPETPARARQWAVWAAKAQEAAKTIGLSVYIQTDPRGCALYLVPADKKGFVKDHSADYASVGLPCMRDAV